MKRPVLAILVLAACDGGGSSSDGGTIVDSAVATADAAQADAASVDAAAPDAAAPDAIVADATVPISRRLVYAADQDLDGIRELFLTRFVGTTPLPPIRLHDPLDATQNAGEFWWAPDGSAVVYEADTYPDADMTNTMDLWVVEVGGPPPYTPVRVNAEFPRYGDAGPQRGIGEPKWSPDSQWIAYVAEQEEEDYYHLYIYKVTGTNAGMRWRVNGPLTTDSDVYTFTWSPDSTRIAYRTRQTFDWELYVAKVADGGPTTAVSVSTGIVQEDGFRDMGYYGLGFQFAPDSQSIAYRTRINDVQELHWVDLSGTDPAPSVKLGASAAAGSVDSAFWAPNGSWIAYRAHEDSGLYAVKMTSPPAAPVKLNGLEYAGGSGVYDFPLWAPDSTKIAYNTGGGTGVELWVVNLTGVTPSVPRRANPALPVNGNVELSSAGQRRMAWSSDSALLVFASEFADPNQADLFVVDTTTTPPWTPHRVDAVNDTWPNFFYFAPAARTLLYRKGMPGIDSRAYLADLSGTAPYPTVEANGPMTLGGNLIAVIDFDHAPWAWHPDGNFVAYLADEKINERFELFVVDVSQPGVSVQANDVLIPPGDLFVFEWAPAD